MTEIVAPESTIKVVSLLFISPNISSLVPEVGASSIFSIQLEIDSLLNEFECLLV